MLKAALQIILLILQGLRVMRIKRDKAAADPIRQAEQRHAENSAGDQAAVASRWHRFRVRRTQLGLRDDSAESDS